MAEVKRQKVNLTDIAYGGDCVGRIDNQVVFASYGLPGEEVIVELSQSKRDFCRGRVVEVVSPSPARVEPRCPLFGRCGGCRWQHIDYSTQLELKRKVVADQLRRIGGFHEGVTVNPTLGMDDPWHYRNNSRFTVRHGRLGFLEEKSHRFLAVDKCYLLHPALGQALSSLQDSPPENADQVTVRCGVNTGQLLIDPPSVRKGAVPAGGKAHLEETLLGRRFRLAAASFFQVNTAQAERLALYLMGRLQPKPDDTLLDIYCGVGTFGLLLADKVRRVVGIEEYPAALRDAKYNARDLENVEFIQGAAEDVMGQLEEHVDAAIIDPPRAGIRSEVVSALRRLGPKRIVYVSCDPATLARDLKLLCADRRYRVADVQPIDMFPQTYHVEAVVTLESP